MRGASGGHRDAAAAATTIVVALLAKPHPDRREARYHPPHAGESIDVLVTDHGIAVNPARPEIRERLMEAGAEGCRYQRAV